MHGGAREPIHMRPPAGSQLALHESLGAPISGNPTLASPTADANVSGSRRLASGARWIG